MTSLKRLLLFWLMSICTLTLSSQGGKSITLISPNGGLNLKAGQSAFIHWSFSGYPDNTLVRIVLWQNGNKLGDVTEPVTIQNPAQNKGHGGYFWTVGAYSGKTAAPGCGYAINVRVLDETDEHAMSSETFCIIGAGQASSIKVNAPNGGENWLLGSPQEIRWTATGLTGNAKIYLRKSGWNMDLAIATDVKLSDGKLSWKAGDLLPPHGDVSEPASTFKIIIKTANGSNSDESDNAFSMNKVVIPDISDTEHSGDKWIKITGPKAGSTFTRINECMVTWTFSASLNGTKAKLQLLKPDGSLKMQIEAKIPLKIDDYRWHIPGRDQIPVGDYKLRLKSNDYPGVYADSGIIHIIAKKELRKKNFSLTPVITNKLHQVVHREKGIFGSAFAVVPDEVPDPAPSCGRVGWIDRCGDDYDAHHVYRSHLQFSTGNIPAGAQVISASMTWTSDGNSPPVTLYLPLQKWNGEPLSLFSLPVKKLDPNSPKKEIWQAVLSWRESPKYNYGIVVTGNDESMDCQGNWHVWKICDIKIEGEMMVSEEVD